MPELKLAKLTDRTPIKMTILILPELHQALAEYALAYHTEYGREEPVAELIPAMLTSYIESDRSFSRGRTKK